MSQEYIGALVLLLGAVLKIFKIQLENSILEGLIAGVVALWIAFRRFKKGDITIIGARK